MMERLPGFLAFILGVCALAAADDTAPPQLVDECCEALSAWPECSQACKQLSLLECTPTYEKRAQYLNQYCLQVPDGVLTCLNNSEVSRPSSPPTPSPQARCCNETSNPTCHQTCVETLASGNLDNEAILRMRDACGPPLTVTSDPVWGCLLSFSPGSQTGQTTNNAAPVECEVSPIPDYSPGDWARVQCCLQANSSACREACIQEYTNKPIGSTLTTLHHCRNMPTEGRLETCLRDTDATCKLGCSEEMQFCSQFTNRPLTLFRKCNALASVEAKLLYTEWGDSKSITHPLDGAQISVNVYNCNAELWRLTACSLHIQPCHPKTHTTLLCYDDCMKLIGECMIQGSRSQAMQICNELSPPYLQETCIPFSEYLNASTPVTQKPTSLQFPCDSNPCVSGLNCSVNHDCHHNDKTCTPYTCSSGCSLNTDSALALNNADNAYIGLPIADEDCYGFAIREDGAKCSYGNNVTAAYCEDQGEHSCVHLGKTYAHREHFQPDSDNYCVCYYGRMTCTNQLLLSSCNCPADYRPVCTHTGRTIPNLCYASCLGFEKSMLKDGDCVSLADCSSHTCQQGSRCVPRPHACLSGQNLTSETACLQYSCEPQGLGSCAGILHKPVCDKSGKEHSSMCSLLQTNKLLDYRGYCKEECTAELRQPVCGVDGQTYPSHCHSEAARVAIDYVDSCHEVPEKSQNPLCGIKCPVMPIFDQNEQCIGSTPPGACCPQCGAIIRVVMDQQLMRRTAVAIQSSIISTDIISRLRRMIDNVECDLYGHIWLDRTAVIIVLPVITNTTTLFTLQACNEQAQRIATLINNRSPVIASDPHLAYLVGAQVQTAEHRTQILTTPFREPILPPNSSAQTQAQLYMVSLMVVVTIVLAQLLTDRCFITSHLR